MTIQFEKNASLRPLTILATLFLLTGCASPTGVQFAPPSLDGPDQTTISGTKIQNVFVATLRKPSEETRSDFTGARDQALNYSRYSVSIPPNHKVGQIEWPKGKPDLSRHFVVTDAEKMAHLSAFDQKLNDALMAPENRSPDGKRELVLFIHGYNTDFSEGLYRAAQLKHDYGMKSPLVHFSWPSAGETGLYVYDRDSVKVSRDHLAKLIRRINRSKADRILLTAHSLGNELLMETLRQLALTNGGKLPSKIQDVVLISPDVDIDVFNSQLAPIKTLPKNFAIFVSRKDRALEFSSFLTGDRARVGNNIEADRILRPGIRIIDVTDFDGGDDLNHFTAATSPNLVQLLKGLKKSGGAELLSSGSEEQQKSVANVVVDTATLPVQLVVRTTQAILNP